MPVAPAGSKGWVWLWVCTHLPQELCSQQEHRALEACDKLGALGIKPLKMNLCCCSDLMGCSCF